MWLWSISQCGGQNPYPAILTINVSPAPSGIGFGSNLSASKQRRAATKQMKIVSYTISYQKQILQYLNIRL